MLDLYGISGIQPNVPLIDHIYAVVIGYEDMKGDVRLLRSFQVYPSQYAFEAMAGMKTMKVVALVRKTAESE